MGEWCQASVALTPGEKGPHYPQNKTSVPPRASLDVLVTINLLPLHGFEPRFLGGAVRPVVTVLSELHRPFLLDYKLEHCQSNTHSSCAINVLKVPDRSARLTVPVQLQGDTNCRNIQVHQL